MKIKADFVTNSSSTAYIVVDSSKNYGDLKNLLWEEGVKKRDIEHCITFNSVEDVEEFNNYGDPLDWIEKITGPPQNYMSELYDIARSLARQGKQVSFLELERGVDLYSILSDYDDLKIEAVEGW